MTIEQIAVNRWTAIIQEDTEGNLYLPLNENMLAAAGWKEGDILEWEVTTNEHGICAVLTRKESPIFSETQDGNE